MTKNTAAAVLLVLLTPAPLFAGERDSTQKPIGSFVDESDSTKRPLGFFVDIEAGAIARFVSQSDSSSSISLNMHSTPLYIFNAGAQFGLLGQTLLSFEYQTTLPRTTFSEEAVRVSTDETLGLERYGLGFAVDPLVRALAPNSTWLQVLLSFQLRYQRELTETNAEVTQDATYLPGNIKLQKGTTYTFQTLYDYREATIRVSGYWLVTQEFEKTIGIIRLGVFQYQYGRPFSVNNVIYEGTIRSTGMAVGLEPKDPGRRGLRGYFQFAKGFSNELTSGISDWNKTLNVSSAKELYYDCERLGIGLWYNWYFSKGFFLTLGGSFTSYTFKVQYGEDSPSKGKYPKVLVNQEDNIYRGWVAAAYRF